MENIIYKDQPIQLVTLDSEGSFEITYEGSQFLSSLADKKLSVLSITGPYRSGKSFLANLIMNQMSGFKTGSTTNACTKGIWAWGRPCELSDGTLLIVLDSEGLGSVEKDRELNIDLKLFTFCILVSSTIVYNSKHSISEDKIEELANVANLTNRIKLYENTKETEKSREEKKNQPKSNKKSDEEEFDSLISNSSELTDCFPKLIWAVRDFSLDLQGMSANEYLEKALSSSDIENSKGKNESRNIIKKNFKDRECITIVIPTNDPKKLKNLEFESREVLRKEFCEAIDKLVEKIKNEKRKKIIKGVELDGITLLGLIQNFIDALNNNETPVIMSSLESVLLAKAGKQQQVFYEKFKQLFLTTESNVMKDNQLTKTIEKLELPLSNHELINNYFEISTNIITDFTKSLSPTLTPFQVGNYCTTLLAKCQNDFFTTYEQNLEYLDAWVDIEHSNIAKIINNTIKNNFNVKPINSESNSSSKNLDEDSYSNEIFDIEIEKPEDLVRFCYLLSGDFQQQFSSKLKLFPEIAFSKLFMKVNKLIEETVFIRLRNISRSLNNIMISELGNLHDQIDKLKLTTKKQKEQATYDKKLLDEIKKEKNELYKSKLELESKFDSTLRELKNKEREFTNNLNIESQKYSRMENYYLNILKEKNQAILEEEKKVISLNKELSILQKEISTKSFEFKKESSILNYEIEKIKTSQKSTTSYNVTSEGQVKNSQVSKGNQEDDLSQLQIQSIFKNLQSLYIDFKELIEKSDRERESVFRKKFFELSNKDIEKKTLSLNYEVKMFRDGHLKEIQETYEKKYKDMMIEISDLKLKIDQLELLVSEEKNSNEVLKIKIDGQKKQMEEVKKISESKSSIITNLKDHLSTYEEKAKNWKEEKENFEYKICELASGMRMKDDEMETVVMLLESILSKNKRKFDNHINRIDENITNSIMRLVKDYKIFK